MSAKSTFLKAFNKRLFEFFDDILVIFPDDVDLKRAKKSCETLVKCNVSMLIKIWYSAFYVPYREPIMAGDLDFFLNKDYADDIAVAGNSQETLAVIDKLRQPIRLMGEENQAASIKAIQQLSKCSELYSQS